MLKLFRKRNLLVRILIFAAVVPVGIMMVVTLVPGLGQTSFRLQDPQGVLAQIGDNALSQLEVQQEYQRRVERMGTESAQFRRLIYEGLIEDLILQRAAEYEAQRLGLRVTPDELGLQRRQFSIFYPNGEFVGAAAYAEIVSQELNMSVPQFEQQLRRQVLLTKLFFWVTAGVSVSPAEVEQEYRRRNEQAQIEFVVLRPDALASSVQPGEEELQSYFERNRERYQIPERRAVRFVPIDYLELSRRVSLTRQELEDYYQRNRDSYRVPERVRARHILFLGTAEAATAAANPARQQAEEVLAQLRRGGNFAALAKKHSAHAESRDKGGELGWIQRGQTVEALDKALFSLPAGGPAELVETGYGVHLVQVLERQPERVRPLAEVRPEIEPGLKQQKVEQAATSQARRLADAVRGGKSLEAGAREAGWPVQDSPAFARAEKLQPFGDSQDFQEAAFSLPAATAGQPTAPVSEPLALPAGYAILQLKAVSPAHQASFEEVRAEVERAWRQERGSELAREAATKLADAANEKGDLRAAARAAKLEVTTTEQLGRYGVIPTLGSVRDLAPLIFSLPVGSISSPVLTGGNWVVFRVLARREVDPVQMTEPEREAMSGFLREQKRTLTWNVFTSSVKKQLLAEGKLKLNEAAINRLTGQS